MQKQWEQNVCNANRLCSRLAMARQGTTTMGTYASVEMLNSFD